MMKRGQLPAKLDYWDGRIDDTMGVGAARAHTGIYTYISLS